MKITRKLGLNQSLLSLFLFATQFIAIAFFTTQSASARDLHGRLGLGYNDEFAVTPTQSGAPGISLRYGLTARAQIELIAGFYSGDKGSGVTALKYMQTIHPETYMNFYYLIGGGAVSANGRSGTEWLGGFGTEFFIPGIESIGLAFETGLDYENLTSTSFVLKTFGLSFFNVGMHFYF